VPAATNVISKKNLYELVKNLKQRSMVKRSEGKQFIMAKDFLERSGSFNNTKKFIE